MSIKNFEEIITWQKAKELTVKVYQSFRVCRDFGFKDQIERASVSIMNNIAEGYERSGNKEFKHFLFISKGSCGEVRSMLYLALQLKYISKMSFNEMNTLSLEISKMLSGFIKVL
ncbi:four helix bundle protein [Candidatus Roizmanbacteria bacterium CG2_30_33_16]|uniref:Four helix bundle protein n=1 Tax=Candidatus Roizmanbacteria bacterium CG2_30_33_16 TaxID=1805340 RepID=A0A1J5HH54_9BACT|nr:MAG: four helix bundle protein [Candidatus Roizmanbacteria bacterium CG2_30_33_16]OIP83779.1 MAG: four helix bundle protein [Candidatus Roizmanbacteria bacterium CG2_30_33_16]